jgi:hypothetical protein
VRSGRDNTGAAAAWSAAAAGHAAHHRTGPALAQQADECVVKHVLHLLPVADVPEDEAE